MQERLSQGIAFPKKVVLLDHLSTGEQQPINKRLKLAENKNICTSTKVSCNECTEVMLKKNLKTNVTETL